MNHSVDLHLVQLNFYSAPSQNSSSGAVFPDSADLQWLLLLTIREPTTIALTVLYSLSFSVGVVGNVMSIKVLTSRRSRRLSHVSTTRILLVNLAVCDLTVVCVCMPITLGYHIYTSWVYGDLLCRAVPFVQATSVSASVLSLTVISINRYYSVRSPLSARAVLTWRRISCTITAVWLVSSAICAPLLFMNQRQEVRLTELPLTLSVCREAWPHARLKQAYNVLLFIALYCLPVTFNLTISLRTGQELWRTSQSFAEFEAAHACRLKMRKKIAKMVVALVLLFAASWLPFYATDMWIDRDVDPPPWILQLRPFAQWLGLTNSSLNPICYCFIGDLYRSARLIKTRYQQRVVSFFSSSYSEGARSFSMQKTTTNKGSETAGQSKTTQVTQHTSL